MPDWTDAYRYVIPAILAQFAQEMLGLFFHTKAIANANEYQAAGAKNDAKPRWSGCSQAMAIVRIVLVGLSWILLIVAVDDTMTHYDPWSKATRQGYVISCLLTIAAAGIGANVAFAYMIADNPKSTWYDWLAPMALFYAYATAWHLFGQFLWIARHGVEEAFSFTGTTIIPFTNFVIVFVREADFLHGGHISTFIVFYAMLFAGWAFVGVAICREPSR
jgi:hypothetical protein